MRTQNNTDANNQTNAKDSKDSIELLALTKRLLRWHEVDRNGDFSPAGNNDSIYTGIDWDAHKARIDQLIRTNLFTQEFINNYKKIAFYLDNELKRNPVKYYKGELPPFGRNDSEWCNCQDYPEDIWSRLMIKNITQNKDLAAYYWTWGDDSNYFVKVEKKNGCWKITYLEGFDIRNYTWD